MTDGGGDDRVQRMLFDYERACDLIQHYEQLNWQIGAILFAGVFVLIGLSFDQLATMPSAMLPFVPYIILVVIVADLFWFLWSQRNIAIVASRFRRLKEIEDLVPEVHQYSCNLEDDAKLWTPSGAKGPQLRLLGLVRHRILVRLYCILLPLVLIAMYVQLFVELYGFHYALLINLAILVPPLLIFVFYPRYPWQEQALLPSSKCNNQDAKQEPAA